MKHWSRASRPARRRTAGLAAIVALALTAAGCQSATLPATVVKGSEVAVGWSGSVTNANPAATAEATQGNIDVAALTRGHFAELVEGEVQTDRSFGKVSIVDKDPFTVRYDLATPQWSDGIGLDGADLLLAWAARDPKNGFAGVRTGLALSDELVDFDESKRSLEVSFTQPVSDWATALDVAVPAHAVAQTALGIDDPIEAKKAVIDAVRDDDTATLKKLAETWNTGFQLFTDEKPTARQLISSGPYRITGLTADDAGTQSVRLRVNTAYNGPLKPSYERIDLRGVVDDDRMAQLGKGLDVVQIDPVPARRAEVAALERRDYRLTTGHDGTMWVLALRGDRRPFATKRARTAFLKAVPRSDVVKAGGGAWNDAYKDSDSVLFAPDAEGYDVAIEDSGFTSGLGTESEDPGVERAKAGVNGPAATICLLYDRRNSFGVDAYSVLRTAMAEAGWTMRDCGVDELGEPSTYPEDWQAALINIPVPRTASQLAALWGSDAKTDLTGVAGAGRDDLIAAWGRATDRFTYRDALVAVEKSIVDDAVVLPLAMNPSIVVSTPGVDGVKVRSGPNAALTAGMVEWSRVRASP